MTESRPFPTQSDWQHEIPDSEWAVYREVIEEAQRRELPFMIGGAFSLAGYTGFFRNTKDLDFFTYPSMREPFVDMLDALGFRDYFEDLPYERHWIYRALREDVLIDIIWRMANRRVDVDEGWFSCAPELNLRGKTIRILPPEELIWAKLYVLQRDRCDWTDVFNVLYSAGPALDWDHLFQRLGKDTPLLGGALQVFGWLCPEQAASLPDTVWERLQLPRPPSGPARTQSLDRVDLLDSRPWFPLESLDPELKDRTP
ncbi:MAG: nucleotidyltransferase family protein [Armatimonadetes bacterium]|nr:nucleotidyltransferase family protein [Armatimonadota bacterium]